METKKGTFLVVFRMRRRFLTLSLSFFTLHFRMFEDRKSVITLCLFSQGEKPTLYIKITQMWLTTDFILLSRAKEGSTPSSSMSGAHNPVYVQHVLLHCYKLSKVDFSEAASLLTLYLALGTSAGPILPLNESYLLLWLFLGLLLAISLFDGVAKNNVQHKQNQTCCITYVTSRS